VTGDLELDLRAQAAPSRAEPRGNGLRPNPGRGAALVEHGALLLLLTIVGVAALDGAGAHFASYFMLAAGAL
jgi:hypothetical protein